jgi:hypothetical protein
MTMVVLSNSTKHLKYTSCAYISLLLTYGEYVLGIDKTVLYAFEKEKIAALKSGSSAETLDDIVNRLKQLVQIPENPNDQIAAILNAIYFYWSKSRYFIIFTGDAATM